MGSEAFSLSVAPKRLTLLPGRSASLKVRTRTANRPAHRLEGAITVTPSSGVPIRIPWLQAPKPRAVNLVSQLRLNLAAFDPAETYSILSLQAGDPRLLQRGPTPQIQPIARLEIALRTRKGRRLGLLARLRDQLPGRYFFQITGRAPTGQLLAKGTYRLVVRAYPTVPGPPTRKTIEFRIKK